MFWRTILHLIISRFGPSLDHFEVARTKFVTLPTDQGIPRHMNNGMYLSIMDIARLDLLQRNGVWKTIFARGWSPVVVSETMSFRKSLSLGQRFTVESRILGFDEKAVYIEQRFVRPDAAGRPEMYAQGFVRGRFVKRTGGVVAIDTVLEAIGVAPDSTTVPQWLLEWSDDVTMPATRAPAPSLWQ